MRAVGMAGNLTFPPGRQILVKIAQHRLGLAVQRAGLLLDIHILVGACHRAQLFRLAFDLGQGLFEVEVIGHRSLQDCRGVIWPCAQGFAITSPPARSAAPIPAKTEPERPDPPAVGPPPPSSLAPTPQRPDPPCRAPRRARPRQSPPRTRCARRPETAARTASAPADAHPPDVPPRPARGAAAQGLAPACFPACRPAKQGLATGPPPASSANRHALPPPPRRPVRWWCRCIIRRPRPP